MVLLIITGSISHFMLKTLSHMLERVRDIAEGQGDLTKRFQRKARMNWRIGPQL